MVEHYAGEPEEKQDPWWHMLLLGIATLAAAAFVFDFIDDKERAGESFRINWIFAIIYQVLGKWGIAAALVAIGLGFLVASVRRFPRAKG
jgi:hypothetical protein